MREDHIKQIKEGNVHYFYTSRTWRKKRLEILERDNYECQICKQNGKVTVGTKKEPLVVHHIKELKQYPELALVNRNLLSVCSSCHESVCHPNRLGVRQKEKGFINEERW